jgi:hypothetical protein
VIDRQPSTDRRISITVKPDGTVQAARRWDNGHSTEGRVRYAGLDADLIRIFERWLTRRDQVWRADEIQLFGSLLYRCLLPDQIWSWIEATVDAAGGGADGSASAAPVRLELTFPALPPYSRLAAIPWEYLYRPDRPGRSGQFLATDPRLVVCRYIPLGRGEPALPAIAQPRVLTVVSQPKDPRLGEVDYEDVVAGIETWAERNGFATAVIHDPTAVQLQAAVTGGSSSTSPQLVHFLGHGSFDPDRGEASLALTDPDGGTDWVPDRNIAELFGRGGTAPRVVILHCCEGGRADFGASFAGVAPQLARAGVAAVVAMQYAVTNETAIAFSQSFYQHLDAGRGDAGRDHAGRGDAGRDLAAAVQEARWQISGARADRDPRLVGVPVLYLQNSSALAGLTTAGDAS